MLNRWTTACLALAVAGGSTAAQAQTPAPDVAALLQELQALKARVADLERRLQANPPAAVPPPEPPGAQGRTATWGITPELARELARVTLKAEALEDGRDAAGLKLLKIGGYADPTYLVNRRQHRAGFQFLGSTSSGGYAYDDSTFGAIALDLLKETDSGTRWRLTLIPNRGSDAVIGNGGVVHEASVSVPLTNLQTRFIAGHMPDWSGYEYWQPTLNKLITHNLLFDFTVPSAYTGMGIDLTRGKWWVRGLLANINAPRVAAGETSPGLAYRVDYARGEFQGFGLAGVHGRLANPADPGGGRTRVDLFEVDGYFIRGDWTLQAQFSMGRHRGAAIAPDPWTGAWRDAQWSGASMLAAYKLTPRLELIARGDVLRNARNGGGLLGYGGFWNPKAGVLGDGRNGIGVDGTLDCATDPTLAACQTGANRSALSLGLSWLWDLNTTFKVEYRLDRASLPVFLDVRDGSYRRQNALFGTSVVVAF